MPLLPPSCLRAAASLLALAVAATPPSHAAAVQGGAGDPAGEALGRVRIEGAVLLPDGGPARGAVVISSAGGQAVTGSDGSFALEFAVARGVDAVELTAVGAGTQGTLAAHRKVDGLREDPSRRTGTLLLAASTGCAPEWTSTFGEAVGANYFIHALTVFDDGSGAGPALYAGGEFSVAGSQPANRIARWDGAGWSALGSGMDGGVYALCVFDDGTGPALYAGGEFSSAGEQPANRIARWDGQDWSAVGTGMNDRVSALAVCDDGSGAGPALYAGGWFTTADGQAASYIARWDGQTWSALGSGTSESVNALAVYDDGSGAGPGLYVGGNFSFAGGHSANNIARWDAQGWSALGSGLSDGAYSLVVHDDGSGAGPSLFVGGVFSSAGGQFSRSIARWDGQSWSGLGGMSTFSGDFPFVRALAVCDDGSGAGPVLYAAGKFDYAAGQEASNIARWDGQTWTALGRGLTAESFFVNTGRALAVFDDGSGGGPALFAGGDFEFAGLKWANHVARWDGHGWSALGKAPSSWIEALAVFDDGSGPALYAAGYLDSVGGQDARHVAKWDGEGWSALGSGLAGGIVDGWPAFEIDPTAFALAVFDDGSGGGPALYVAGWFVKAGGVAASNVAKWDGQSWSALGSGTNDRTFALTVFDDGSGPALYAGGAFNQAGGQSANHVAKWDGQGWSALGLGTNSWVQVLTTFDDGSGAGPALYAGGLFSSAGGQTAAKVARWDGQGWSALGLGTNGTVDALAVCDVGTGPALFAGGSFTLAGGLSAGRIARWDGQAWSAVGGGLDGNVGALAVFDDGSGLGPALYAGGWFESAEGNVAEHLARWDGQAWSGLASGIGEGSSSLTASVRALASFDDGSGAGPALFAGGDFRLSASGDSHLARFGCPGSPIEDLPGCYGNPATLATLSSAASLGDVFSLQLSSSQLASGLGALFFGADGTDAAGCGVFVPGVGELLLSLTAHVQVGSGLLSAGAITFDLPVPAGPASLVGLEIAFHGAIVGVFEPGVPIELSNGLVAVIHP